MATGQEWAQGLQGMGAWFAGQGPQYEAAKSLQQRNEAEDVVLRDERRRAAMIQDYTMIGAYADQGQWDKAQELVLNRLDMIQKLGGNPKDTLALYEAIADPARRPEAKAELDAFRQAGIATGEIKAPPTAGQQYSGIFTTQDGRRAGLNNNSGQVEYLPSQEGITARAPEAAQLPASLQEMAWLNNPQRTAEELDMYWRNKRAEQIVASGGGGQLSVSPSGQQTVVVAPEDAAAAAAAAAAAVKTAEGTAAADAEAKAKRTKATQIYNPFSTQLVSLRDAFQGTATGPLAGRITALTTNAQKAEAAANIMEPIIKGVVRDAGEGTFTEGDRAQITDMMPKRTDHPEVVIYKMQLLDNFVRGKLGVPSDMPSPLSPPGPVGGGFKVRSVK